MYSLVAIALGALALHQVDATAPVTSAKPVVSPVTVPVVLPNTGNTVAPAKAVVSQLLQAEPKTAPPATATTLNQTLFNAFGSKQAQNPSDFFTSVVKAVAGGIKLPTTGIRLTAGSPTLVDPITGTSSTRNVLRIKSPDVIYPRSDPADPTYSLPEAELQRAIYIPPTFSYGKRRPVLFVPGTGGYGGTNFGGNLLKVLTGVPYADPVVLNVPGAMSSDAQLNAEYIAYAINYIAAITKRKDMAVTTWSLGGLNTQWVFTFWPSTRAVVTDFLPVAADFHGALQGNLMCLGTGLGTYNGLPCVPAVIQQQVDSLFINALFAHGGGDVWVPTTTFRTFFDEVVQPQVGPTGSGTLADSRKIGVLNVAPQEVCPFLPAGSLYGHASLLYNPLVVALVKDALQNEGPGSLARIDTKVVCRASIAPGLSLTNAIDTIGQILGNLIGMLVYTPKINLEPPLKAYAVAGAPAAALVAAPAASPAAASGAPATAPSPAGAPATAPSPAVEVVAQKAEREDDEDEDA